MLPLVAWLVVAIVVFDLTFVAFRLWATRERSATRERRTTLGERPPSVAPAYATILAKEYPHRSRRVHRRDLP